MATKLKYINSHWLVFAVQGIIGLLFGWFVIFTNIINPSTLTAAVGITMLALGLVEIFNLINRAHAKNTFGLTLLLTIFQLAVAIALL